MNVWQRSDLVLWGAQAAVSPPGEAAMDAATRLGHFLELRQHWLTIASDQSAGLMRLGQAVLQLELSRCLIHSLPSLHISRPVFTSLLCMQCDTLLYKEVRLALRVQWTTCEKENSPELLRRILQLATVLTSCLKSRQRWNLGG